jgi:hypothetical protein
MTRTLGYLCEKSQLLTVLTLTPELCVCLAATKLCKQSVCGFKCRVASVPLLCGSLRTHRTLAASLLSMPSVHVVCLLVGRGGARNAAPPSAGAAAAHVSKNINSTYRCCFGRLVLLYRFSFEGLLHPLSIVSPPQLRALAAERTYVAGAFRKRAVCSCSSVLSCWLFACLLAGD